jgi:hypothetical protein
MATVNGTPVNFGFTGTNGITITGLSGTLLQNVDQAKAADVENTKNGVGDVVTRGWTDIHDEATIEFVVTDSSSQAAARTATTLSSLVPGAFIAITACASRPDLVATWEVQAGAKVIGGNVNAAKISVPLHKRAGVTAVAGA